MNIKRIETKNNFFILTDTVTNKKEIQFAKRDIHYKDDGVFVTFFTYLHNSEILKTDKGCMNHIK